MATQPESLLAAVNELRCTGSVIAAENAATAVAITGVPPAAADEVSAIAAMQFAFQGATYQAVSAQASDARAVCQHSQRQR
jgi:hypothetical protein